jgi:hypothetical protein
MKRSITEYKVLHYRILNSIMLYYFITIHVTISYILILKFHLILFF